MWQNFFFNSIKEQSSQLTINHVLNEFFNRDVDTIIEHLCNDVEEGRAIGGLCREFCQPSVLKPVQCQAWHGGKEIVFKAEFHGNSVYVKG